MQSQPSETALIGQTCTQPLPWERQTGEPLERYRWFQICLTLPPPRSHAAVARIAGLPPASRRVAVAARRWNWEERAAAAAQESGFLGLQEEWRIQLLDEAAYLTRYTDFQETAAALAAADVGGLDRDAARKRLPSLVQHQRGLQRLMAPPKKEDVSLVISPKKLQKLVYERYDELALALFEQQHKQIFGEDALDDAAGRNNGSGQQSDGATDNARSDKPEPPAADEPSEPEPSEPEPHEPEPGEPEPHEPEPREPEPWQRQPEESAKHFHLFRIYLSLMFFQSTHHVARMAATVKESTLAKIARKWRWQERAAAFDAHHTDQPFARAELQLELTSDIAYESQLYGLLDSTRAIRTAGLGRLDRTRARAHLTLLFRRQRGLLQSFWRQHAALDGDSVERRRQLLLAPLINKLAAEQLEISENEEYKILLKIFGHKLKEK